MKKCVALLLIACGLPASLIAQDSGFLSDYSKLEVSPNSGFTRIYIRPGTLDDLARINKLMIDQPSIIISDDSKYKGFKPSDVVLVAEELRAAVVDGVQGQYPVVEQPGDGVAYARWAVSNVRVNKAKRGVLSFTPVGAVAYGAKKAMSDVVDKTRAFDVVLEMEVSDSVSDEVFFAATLDVTETGEEAHWSDALAIANALGQRLACRLNNSRLAANERQDCQAIKVELGEF